MESGSSGGGGLEGEFEDSLGDFDETVMGGTAGGGGGSEEEIDILSPTGEGSSGPPTGEPLFEEGDAGDDGSAAENQSVAQRAESGSSEGSDGSSSQQGGGGSEGGGQESQGGASSSSGGASGGGAGATQANRKMSTTSAGGGQEGAEEIVAIPEDIGDGRNDDIVLRQIRDAAMNETDPVLRERLWDEYRRIRGSR
jgi:hypothetical protein